MTRLPALGPRGEGWVAVQVALVTAVGLGGALGGRGWPDAVSVLAVALGLALMALGVAVVVAGAGELGQASWTALPTPRAAARLSKRGLRARARHPMYGGAILVAIGWTLIFPSVVGAIATALLVLFFELKSRREEALLAERFPDYAAYRSRTPRRFLPWLY